MFRHGHSLVAMFLLIGAPLVKGGEVTGRVEMPATCSPTVSPAVVNLERIDGKVEPVGGRGTDVALVNQKGLQFEPRVQAIRLGQTIRFTNADNETHNVHIMPPGPAFNQSMARGMTIDYVADRPGVLSIGCDVHSHMRGYVVVSPTPYVTVCLPDGRFRLDAVPSGRYRLHAWHEMGKGVTVEIDLKGDVSLVVPTIAVESTAPTAVADAPAPVRPWSEVTGRIGVLLSEARIAATKPGGVPRARKLAEDAYFDEFEGSTMEIAVGRSLGFAPKREIERQLKTYRATIREVGAGSVPASALADQSRELMLSLYRASEELNRLGVTDRTKVDVNGLDVEQENATNVGDLAARQDALAQAFAGVATLANSGDPGEASSAMSSAYLDAFEPLERMLAAHRPQEIRPLEARFNALRGRIGQGLRGEPLVAELASLRTDVSSAIERSRAGGTFVPAFFASLVTILREGVEVILLLTMLIALVAKAGQPRALTAIRRGVGVAILASLLTAVGLNLLVATSQGRAREQIEGWVLMLAAGVLFYVSYWLISQSESKRWTQFLKDQVGRGVAAGGFGTLGLTAFLAVYREGAETALMYQAMIAGQAGSRAGLLGLVAGLAVGGAGLTVIYRIIRTTSVKLPLRSFFKVTGIVLFAMAVVFAGNGVNELQSAGLLKITPIAWLGTGLPWLGMHPNVQVVSIQGLLMLGALTALVILLTDRGADVAKAGRQAAVAGRERVAV